MLRKDALLDHATNNISLSYKEAVVDAKLNKLGLNMKLRDRALILGDYHEMQKKLENSPLYECLYKMPKPAVHHAHLTACASLDFLVGLTYKNCVYYSQRANEFHVSANGCTKPGFIKVNTLR